MDNTTSTSATQSPSPRPPSARGRTFEALHYKDYRYLWFATLFNSGGNWIQQTTIGWLAYRVTSSPLQVSIILGLRTFPLLLAPVAGVLADRFDRRKLLLANLSFLAVLALAFSASLLAGQEQTWHLYVFALLTGVGWAINNPTRQALVANSVPQESLMNAIALNSMAFNSMRILGPAIGGGMIALFGPGLNFLIQGILYVCATSLIVPFRAVPGANMLKKAPRSPLRDLMEGFKYVTTDSTVRMVILVALVPTLLILAFVSPQLPAYTAEVLGLPGRQGATALGLLLMAAGLGGFLGTLLMARFSAVKRKGLVMTVGLVGATITLLVLSQTRTLAAACGVLVLQQGSIMMLMTSNATVLQSLTPDAMRGRVMGVYMMNQGMNPVGASWPERLRRAMGCLSPG